MTSEPAPLRRRKVAGLLRPGRSYWAPFATPSRRPSSAPTFRCRGAGRRRARRSKVAEDSTRRRRTITCARQRLNALPAAAPYPTRPKIPRGACASSWRRSSGRRRSVVSWRQSNAQDSKVMVPLAGINQGIPSSKKTSFLSGCANHLFWRWDVTKALPRILLLVSGLICVSSSAVAGWFGPDNFKECLFEKMKGQSAQMLPLAADYCTREFPACWWNGKSYYSTCMKGKPLDAWNVSECVKYMNKKCEE